MAALAAKRRDAASTAASAADQIWQKAAPDRIATLVAAVAFATVGAEGTSARPSKGERSASAALNTAAAAISGPTLAAEVRRNTASSAVEPSRGTSATRRLEPKRMKI